MRRTAPRTPHLFDDRGAWPQDNDKREGELRKALLDLEHRAPLDACQELAVQEARHGVRRDWVWAQLGDAPLSQALESLAVLSGVTRQELGGATPLHMARLYQDGAWRADAAVLRARACVTRAEDVAAVRVAVRAVYLPWAEKAAQRLQQLVESHGFPGEAADARAPITAVPGECLLFADGLRYDTGQLLSAELLRRGHVVADAVRWVGHPSVTATCKPAGSSCTICRMRWPRRSTSSFTRTPATRS